MIVTLSLVLPGEASSVRVARKALSNLLDALGVVSEDRHDICVALTEACTNVVDHAQVREGYQVQAEVEGDRCRVTVSDRGRGFDPGVLESQMCDGQWQGSLEEFIDATSGLPTADRGRGMKLIHALTDRFGVRSKPGEGVVVHLEKKLTLAGPPTAKVSLSVGSVGRESLEMPLDGTGLA
jgi:serine/threonine-protein kinase RsbW